MNQSQPLTLTQEMRIWRRAADSLETLLTNWNPKFKCPVPTRQKVWASAINHLYIRTHRIPHRSSTTYGLTLLAIVTGHTQWLLEHSIFSQTEIDTIIQLRSAMNALYPVSITVSKAFDIVSAMINDRRLSTQKEKI